MSLTWPLTLYRDSDEPGDHDVIEFTESGSVIDVEIRFPDAMARTEIDEDGARRLRDWLSWYLGEGPEPGTA